MRIALLGLGLMVCSVAVSAEDSLLNDSRLYDSSDYSAQAYYRLNFGQAGVAQSRHVLGFQTVNQRADAQGAPALFKAELNGSGLPQVSMNGVNVTRALLAAQQNDGNILGGLTLGERITIVVAIVIVGFGTYEATQNDPPATGAGP